MKRVLVTGGTGFLGRSTVQALVGAGHKVRVIARDPVRATSALAGSGSGVEIVGGDPARATDVAAAVAGMDAVVQLAAAFSYGRSDEGVLSENASLARTVLSVAGEADVTRVVDVSSLIVFSLAAEHLDGSVPLTRPGEPGWTDPYLRSKVEAEIGGRELEDAGLPRVTVHPGPIIGPDDSGPGPSGVLLMALLRGGMIPDARTAWVDVRDVARGIALALDAPVGARLLLTSGVATHRDTSALIDDITGANPRRIFLSPSMTRTTARLNDLTRGRLGALPEARRLDFMLQSARSVDVSGTEQQLGMTFRPLRETLADTIRWWAVNGTIKAGVAGRLAVSTPAGTHLD